VIDYVGEGRRLSCLRRRILDRRLPSGVGERVWRWDYVDECTMGHVLQAHFKERETDPPETEAESVAAAFQVTIGQSLLEPAEHHA
jgi:hypothetical protein